MAARRIDLDCPTTRLAQQQIDDPTDGPLPLALPVVKNSDSVISLAKAAGASTVHQPGWLSD
jgi:hypothetical protein